MWAMWNGELQRLAEVRVPALDRGFLFGDAVYEVVRLYAGRVWLPHEHLARLAASLASLRIPARLDELPVRMSRLAAHAGAREASLYVQITRGDGPRSHVPTGEMRPNELLFVQELAPDFGAQKRERGVTAHATRDLRWRRCDVKSTNLLGNVLSAMEARDAGSDEALLVGDDGFVTEGTHATFFGVKGCRLVTTPLSQAILPSVTRSFVLELARRLGLPCDERSLAATELAGLDEAFFCGTLSEIAPVVALDGRPVGTGSPGGVTRRLQGAFAEAVAAFCGSE